MRQEPCRKLHGFSESMYLLTVTRSLRLIGLGEEWDEEGHSRFHKAGARCEGPGKDGKAIFGQGTMQACCWMLDCEDQLGSVAQDHGWPVMARSAHSPSLHLTLSKDP